MNDGYFYQLLLNLKILIILFLKMLRNLRGSIIQIHVSMYYCHILIRFTIKRHVIFLQKTTLFQTIEFIIESSSNVFFYDNETRYLH